MMLACIRSCWRTFVSVGTLSQRLFRLTACLLFFPGMMLLLALKQVWPNLILLLAED